VCAARLEQARSIESLSRPPRGCAQPPASFTPSVMLRVGQELWKAERAIDFGFNLAMAAGIAVIIAGGAGTRLVARISLHHDRSSPPFFRRSMPRRRPAASSRKSRPSPCRQCLLTMALAVWWWAEQASD
jgi:hypothetical protein